jgi:hypothetical protein
MKPAAVLENVPSGFIGHVETLRDTNTHGLARKDTESNLCEAVLPVLEANKQFAQEEACGRDAPGEEIGGLAV